MSDVYVLDSSAVLCLIAQEPGATVVADVMPRAVIGAVNYAEVVSKLIERSSDPQATAQYLGSMELDVVDYTQPQAFGTGVLRQRTRSGGLSLGDRACLALAAERKAIAVTTDKAWKNFDDIARVLLVR